MEPDIRGIRRIQYLVTTGTNLIAPRIVSMTTEAGSMATGVESTVADVKYSDTRSEPSLLCGQQGQCD
jgi:hypothetical protein